MNPTYLTVQVAALAVCFWMETVAPLFMERPQRIQHWSRNLSLGLLNGFILTFGFSAMVAWAARWGSTHPLGLVHWFNLSPSTERLIGFLTFDLWMYLWHRANHGVDFLWRFHRVHHSDLGLDASSAYRFHVGEMVFSTLLRLGVIPFLGIGLDDLLAYEICLAPVIIFHHSNIRMPERLDRWMRCLIVSPNMHRVHHSDIPEETNSNYASIFSFWDRLWKTYRQREAATIRYGLKELRQPSWHTILGMLRIPAAKLM